MIIYIFCIIITLISAITCTRSLNLIRKINNLNERLLNANSYLQSEIDSMFKQEQVNALIAKERRKFK